MRQVSVAMAPRAPRAPRASGGTRRALQQRTGKKCEAGAGTAMGLSVTPVPGACKDPTMEVMPAVS